jgi:glycosyltransferase involved in cell wall biosynthesis
MSPTGDAAPRGLSRLGIVIPARNEGARLAAVLRTIPREMDGLAQRLAIVVDDGSSDATSALAQELGAHVARHPVNLGKGAALSTGCLAALKVHCDVIALMDADGQHDPLDLPRLIQPILSGRADLSTGVRRLSGQMPVANRLGNWGLATAFRVMFGLQLADTQCGFRAFRASIYPQIRWQATDYSVETEMLILARRSGLRIAQVEIGAVYHDRFKGTTMGDGIKIFGDMVRLAVSR